MGLVFLLVVGQEVLVRVAEFGNFFFSELCWGKAMVGYTKPQLRKKEESEKLRGEREIQSALLILDLKDGKL